MKITHFKNLALGTSTYKCYEWPSASWFLIWLCGLLEMRSEVVGSLMTPKWSYHQIIHITLKVPKHSCLLGQHCQISWNGCCVGSTRSQGQVRWDWWCDCDWIWSGMVRGQLVEIGMSHQIWWNILREHNWGVPSAHINFIYYVTYIVEYLLMLGGYVHTGAYTILYLHVWELLFPWSVWECLELHLGSPGWK